MGEHESKVRSVGFSPSVEELVSASDDGVAKIWSTISGDCLRRLEPGCWMYSTQYSWDQKFVLLASDDGAIIWDIDAGSKRYTFRHENASSWMADDPVRVAVFSPDAAQVLTASDDCTARLW